MKKITTLLLIILFANAVQAQSPNWLWAKGMGGTYIDNCFSIAIDAIGNIYTTGRYSDSADFDPGPGVFNLYGDGTFISKLDNAGNFVWAKAIGGGTVEGGKSIAIDHTGSGDVYITGSFSGTYDFDPGTGVFNLTSVGLDDIFISKLDSSGNFVWVKTFGDTLNEMGNSIAIDPSGNVYATGRFEGTVDFDPGAGVFNLTGIGMFISKLDNSGNFVWAKATSGGSSASGISIAIDPKGSRDVYTSGSFLGTVDFDPGAGVFNLTVGGGFISKFDSAGYFIWAKAMGESGLSIALDTGGIGDVLTSGYFSGTVDFDPGAAVFNLTSAGNDVFISKLDSSGKFVWAKQLGGLGYEYGYSIAIDPLGNGDVYTTGEFNGITDFDPGAGIFNLSSAGNGAIFVSKLDGSGNFAWAKAVGGLGNNSSGRSIAVGPSGNVYVTGYFLFPVTFGFTTLNNSGGIYADVFIAKLDTMATVTGNNDVSASLNLIDIFPNPFTGSTVISFSLSHSEKISLKIFDMNGRFVSTLADKFFDAGENELVWNAGEANAGIYFLRMETAGYSENRKLIVAK